jgi:kynurenine formamidase
MDADHRRLEPRPQSREGVEEIAARYRTWGHWGDTDELGCANLVTGDRVAAAAALIQNGSVFALSLPLDRTGPHGGNRARINAQHVMLRVPTDPLLEDGSRQRATDDALYLPLQTSTQWDALCHMFYDGATYNGQGYDSVSATSGAVRNSITNLRSRAVGKAVLLDLPRHLGRPWLEAGESIQSDDLEECLAVQGSSVGEGDFLLVRTGQLSQCRSENSWGAYAGGPAPGLGVDAAHFICGRGIVGVATDTWGIEAIPYEVPEMLAPLHVILLVNAGVYIGEMWDMEDLAADCAADGRYEFFLSAAPLNVTGAVGSPVTPLAIK